ncbi:MAG: hypothetical protein MR419_09345 [Clostridiales bacterium]|nr:hypothetical protein [Clostridiales bacterium]MDY4172875.1 hypothetical protein [Evtepia sp.]
MTPKTKKRLCVVILLAVAATAVLFLLFRPRTFAQTMGPDYDPRQIQEITASLSPVKRDEPSRHVILAPGDPATKEFLTLLESHTYPPVYSDVGGHPVTLDYKVTLFIPFQEETGSAAFLSFTGNPQIQIFVFGTTSAGTYKLSEAAQQELLDLLLKQPYEEQTQ